MESITKVQLAAALVATFGFCTNGVARAHDHNLSATERTSPAQLASKSENMKSGDDKGNKKKADKGVKKANKMGTEKGKEMSCKGKEMSCKGKEGACKGHDSQKK